MGIFGPRRKSRPTAAPDAGRDARTQRSEELYAEMTARAAGLRSVLRSQEARRLVVALEWSWATTAGGGISDPPAPDVDVLLGAFDRLGESDVRSETAAYVAADRALCTEGGGLVRRPVSERRRLEETLTGPVRRLDLSYAPHESLCREVVAALHDLDAASGWHHDVEDLAGCVRWWPGRSDRTAAASADPLHFHLLPRIMIDRADAAPGDWGPPYKRLQELEAGAGLDEPVERDRWVLAALARRAADRGGLG